MNAYKKADIEKRKISRKLQKRVKTIYEQEYSEILSKSQINTLSATIGTSLTIFYINQLRNELRQGTDRATQKVEAEIDASIKKSASLPYDAIIGIIGVASLGKISKKLLKQRSQIIVNALVEKLEHGGFYKSEWSLSKAIWKAGEKIKTDIDKIIADGIANGTSIKELTGALEKYVKPSARKPWDWSKVYPTTSKTVEYNSQRLARTMVQHSYQIALCEEQQGNPWSNGIMWNTSNSHKTCELCQELDGQVFSPEDLPLDHPNGMCYFTPELEDINTIGGDLADWVNGDGSEEVNLYMMENYGL